MNAIGTVAAGENLVVFSAGSASYTARDVLDAAFFRGELQPVWQELLTLIACETKAAEDERDADDAAISAAVQAFRYDRDLITAEETERWLSARGLSLGDFSGYFTRHYWREALGEVDAEEVPLYSAPAELRELLLAEALLSGVLGQFATRLSWRVAANGDAEAPPPSERVAQARQEFIDRVEPTPVGDWLLSAGRDEDWLNQLAASEANFRIGSERVLTPQARQRELVALRLQLTVFEMEVIELDSKDAAREALLCVRDDHMAMEEVAREGRYPFSREQTLLEDIAPDVQQRFLSASAGDLMEPMELDGSYRLCRITGKKEPDPEDPSVRGRVDQRLLDRHFNEVASRHIRWDLLLS